MPIRWTTERISTWRGGELVESSARVAGRWRLRVLSDRRSGRTYVANFDAAFAVANDGFGLWVRTFGSGEPFAPEVEADGVSLQIVGNITGGLQHEVTVRRKPGDDTVARWSCSCGTTSRGDASPEIAREAADAHAQLATDDRPRPRDRAVAQGPDGRWSQAEVAVAQRFRVCVRSELSVARMHQKGIGEEFELAVDGRLELWTRRLGSESALRKDEDGKGVSLLTFAAD